MTHKMGSFCTTVFHGLGQIELMAPFPGGTTSSLTCSMTAHCYDSALLKRCMCGPESSLTLVCCAGFYLWLDCLSGVLCCLAGRGCLTWRYPLAGTVGHSVAAAAVSECTADTAMQYAAEEVPPLPYPCCFPAGHSLSVRSLDFTLPSFLGRIRWLQEGTYLSDHVSPCLCQLREG